MEWVQDWQVLCEAETAEEADAKMLAAFNAVDAQLLSMGVRPWLTYRAPEPSTGTWEESSTTDIAENMRRVGRDEG